MAFNIKNSRQPAPIPGESEYGNVVATQSWVQKILEGFWDWTNHFSTKQIRVGDTSITPHVVATNEMRTDSIYTKRIILVDGRGKPAEIFIGEDGGLQVKYTLNDIYFYPQVNVQLLKYSGMCQSIYDFKGLTPYETFLNFIPYESMEEIALNGVNCPRLCSSDGAEVPISSRPLLVRCPITKKIEKIVVLDEDQNRLGDEIVVPKYDGNPVRHLTINMPYFKEVGTTSAQYIPLPSASQIDAYTKNSVIPPYMKPFHPHCNCLPPRPIRLSDDLFDDDSFFTEEQNGWLDLDTNGKEYEILYGSYATPTYTNINLLRSQFDTNKRQFIYIRIEDAQ